MLFRSQTLEKEQLDKLSAGREIPDFEPGDTVIVNVKVVEGERSRVQAYEGVCIGRSGGGLNESFTVRKISYGEGVERVFPVMSPMIEEAKADELMIVTAVYDHEARKKSYSLLAEAFGLGKKAAA